jgi:glycosyltransferase involved in cell wall biosynthesis
MVWEIWHDGEFGLFQTERSIVAREHPHLTILIVVYNETPQTSTTTRTIVGLAGIKSASIVIWDNSENSQDLVFRSFFSKNGCKFNYVHTPENLALSVIYNRVADLSDDDFLLILDQDTILPCDYLQIFYKAYADFTECKLFVPTIRTGKKLISPSPYFAGWGRSWHIARSGPYPTKNMTIVNSGLIANLALFRREGVRYNEGIKFYGTDTDFFRTYARREKAFNILPVTIDHDSSFIVASVGEKAVKLDQIFSANSIIHAVDSPIMRMIVAVIEIIVRIRYAMRYRTTLFLRSVK